MELRPTFHRNLKSIVRLLVARCTSDRGAARDRQRALRVVRSDDSGVSYRQR
jgi:hypothetical protein